MYSCRLRLRNVNTMKIMTADGQMSALMTV